MRIRVPDPEKEKEQSPSQRLDNQNENEIVTSTQAKPSKEQQPPWAAAFDEGARAVPRQPQQQPPPPPPPRTPSPPLPSSPAQPSTPILTPIPNPVSTLSKSKPEASNEIEKDSSDTNSTLSTEAYNSEDEHGVRAAEVAANAAAEASGGTPPFRTNEEREAHFRSELATRSWRVAVVRADGNCLFRALAYAAWRDEELHENLRSRVMDHVVEERDYFSQFVAEDFPRYVRRKRRNGTHGNHLELQAAADVFGVTIEVYAYSLVPAAVVVPVLQSNTSHVLRLSFHRGSHYNAVVDAEHPFNLCSKKLAVAAAYSGRRSHVGAAAAADEARIAALADTLATEEELEQVALELSLAEHHRSRRGGASSSSSAAPSSSAALPSSSTTWSDVEESIRDLRLSAKIPGAAIAGPSSRAGPSRQRAADRPKSSDDDERQKR